MTPPPLIDMNGRPFPLERQLAAGGEGAVFTLPNDPNRVAKVYHRPPTPQTVEKLTGMIALGNRQLLMLAAWPTGLLFYSSTRHVAGFIMPRLTDCQPIQHLYNPVQRLKFFARAGWTFQLRTAQNLAAAFDEVHKAGCLVGDVNQSNAQVSPQALVRLIDCDSFQVRANGKQYLCEVGVPHYTPPELQGKPLRGLVRTENHDRYGLAVLIYQLLFVGRHPYAGVYRGAGDPSFEQLIAEFRFAQGPMARTWGMDPPPHTPTFADIPSNLGALFRRAFERGSEGNNARPHPTEWIAALRHLEQNASECVADPGHTYWREATRCVWCRLADNGGPEYYFGVAGGLGTFAVDEAKLQDVLRRLAAHAPVAFTYDRKQFTPAQKPAPDPLPEGLENYQNISIVLAGAIGICFLSALTGCCLFTTSFKTLAGSICVVGSFGLVIFAIWLAILRLLSPWHREKHRRQLVRKQAAANLEQIEQEWEQLVRRYHKHHRELSQLVRSSVSDCRTLAVQYQVQLQRLTANAEILALARHLRLHLIADAEISNIGAGRKQLLASFSIFTAADIEYHRIRNIKGFGHVLTSNLVAWKEEVRRQFRFDPATAVSSGEQRSLAVQFRTRQQHILAELEQEMRKIESLAPNCHAALGQLVPKLRDAAAEYEKAEADFSLLFENRSNSFIIWR